MKYTKPEVAVLGQAVSVIESQLTLKNKSSVDGAIPPRANPAYDLDE